MADDKGKEDVVASSPSNPGLLSSQHSPALIADDKPQEVVIANSPSNPGLLSSQPPPAPTRVKTFTPIAKQAEADDKGKEDVVANSPSNPEMLSSKPPPAPKQAKTFTPIAKNAENFKRSEISPTPHFDRALSARAAKTTFIDDMATLWSYFSDDTREQTSKTIEAHVPVLHTFLIKELTKMPDTGIPIIVGTFVQRVFGLTDSEALRPFSYRFNEGHSDGLIEVRRTENHPFPLDVGNLDPPKEMEVSMSRFTFNTKVPLQKTIAFQLFPFTIYHATANLELNTRVDQLDKSLRLRPTFLIDDNEKRTNVILQPAPINTEEALLKKMNQLGDINFLSPYPIVKYAYDKKKNYCPRMSVTFLLEENSMSRFIRIYAPMFLVAVLNTFNLVIYILNRDEESSSFMSYGYLVVSVLLSMAVLHILPQTASAPTPQKLISMNDIYMIWVILSMSVSSIPPSFLVFDDAPEVDIAIPAVGLALLWGSFGIPLMNLFKYLMKKRSLRSRSRTYLFMKDDDYKLWEPSNESVKELKYVEDVIKEEKEPWDIKTVAGNKVELTYW